MMQHSPHPSTALTLPARPLDQRALSRLRRFGGDALLRDTLRSFFARTPALIATVRQGATCGDALAIRAASESLRLSAMQLGALRLQSLSARAEWLTAHDVLAVATVADEMEREYLAVREHVHALPFGVAVVS